MRVRKMLGVAIGATMLVGTSAGAAFAGEVTGNGEPIEVHGRSECAYSGLDDVDEDENPEDPDTDDFGRTQNLGQIVRYAGPIGGASFGCNPNNAPAD